MTEGNMNITLTKKEYRQLVEMLYVADWIMTAHHVTEKDRKPTRLYSLLRKKLLSYSIGLGIDDLIIYDKEADDYFETLEHEEDMHEKFIDDYEERTFWESLSDRLAERDLVTSIGEKEFFAMDPFEKMKKLTELEEKYENEFEKNGIVRLELKK